MNYKLFRLTFPNGVHLGDGSLEDCGINLHADTLFSALCIEAMKKGGADSLEKFVELARGGGLVLSDAFPFMGDEYYLPKPVFCVKSAKDEGDSSAKKAFKNLRYIPLEMAEDYVNGAFCKETVEYISKKLQNAEEPQRSLGASAINARVAIRSGEEEPLPYHIGVYKFGENAGLYFIAGGEADAVSLFREVLDGLSMAGIGGKRSSGLGRFSYAEEDLPEEIKEHLEGSFGAYIALSVSLPGAEELPGALEDASYALLRRSGFVFSDTYADEPLRKNDLYVLGSGSVVRHRYSGDIFDVSNGGAHPVYRYAKPLFYGVNVV